jgi:butyryl-CoA dehydrogenase
MKTADTAASFAELKNYELKFRESINRMGQVLSHLQRFAAEGNVELYMSDANLFMELAGITAVAWQWLKQGIVAQQKLVDSNSDFYYSKMETLKFFYKYELPKTVALAESLMNSDVVTIKGDREVLM